MTRQISSDYLLAGVRHAERLADIEAHRASRRGLGSRGAAPAWPVTAGRARIGGRCQKWWRALLRSGFGAWPIAPERGAISG